MRNKWALLLILIFVGILCKSETFLIDASKNAVMHNNQGLRNYEDGYYAAAIDEFRIAIALSPDVSATATFYNNLGQAYMAIGRSDWAIDCFQRSININPNFLPYYKNFLKAHKANKTISKVRNKYVSLIKKNNSNSDAFLMVGLINLETGKRQEAVNCFKRFIELEPDLSLTIEIRELAGRIK